MRKFIIYGCAERGDANSAYLTRYYITDTSSGKPNLCLHIFHRSDADVMHDHPWNFWTIVLWRGYIEHTPNGQRRFWPGMICKRMANHIHRVELINGKPAVTLCLMGPKLRSWGFWENGVFTKWREYFAKKGC